MEENHIANPQSPHRYSFWSRIGFALIPDVVLTVVTLVLILNPLHHSTYSFHPIFALTSSLIMFIIYVQASWLNPFIAYANEVSFNNSSQWLTLVYAETGFQVALCLAWVAMVVCSCVAVHKWRVGRKEGGKVGEGARRDDVEF